MSHDPHVRSCGRDIATRAVHAGEPRPRLNGAVTMPIFQSSVFETAGEEKYHDIKYIRLSNTPSHIAVQEKLAALEGGDAALVTASGMAAISTTLLSLLSSGDHLLTQSSLYAGTPNFLDHEACRFGISTTAIDLEDPGSWRQHLRPATKAIYVESISNPLLQVPDFERIVAFAREHELTAIIDNTFATPVNFKPLDLGFDISLHSCTKFLNGHSDLVAGAVVGRRTLIDRIYQTLIHLGGSLNPLSCFLLHRSLKTLAVRVKQQNENAGRIARYLRSNEYVSRVYYPGLPDFASHDRARRYFEGFGGMLTFELTGGAPHADELFKRLQLPAIAPSLGGVETSVTRPAATSHFCIPREERERMGVTEGLIRLSIGIENADDLIDDFAQAIGAAAVVQV